MRAVLGAATILTRFYESALGPPFDSERETFDNVLCARKEMLHTLYEISNKSKRVCGMVADPSRNVEYPRAIEFDWNVSFTSTHDIILPIWVSRI